VLLARARRFPYLAVGWLWYLGTLVPVIGLVQVGGQAMADRYTYIPFIGLFIMVAWGISEVTARWRFQKALLALGTAAVLFACGWATWVQAGYWRNSETLFTHALQVTGPNYMAYNHLGLYYADQGRLDQAISMYQKSLAASPRYPHAYNNLGIAYARQGRLDEAIEKFQKAIQLAPTNPTFRRNLAIAYRSQGQKSPAEAVPPR
jgi:tetratricopeptide (TPR) repeat protein